MTSNTKRFSTYTSTSVGPDDEKKKDMWSSMLDNVASGKRLPEKNMLVLGNGTLRQLPELHMLILRDRRERRITKGVPRITIILRATAQP